MAIMTKTLAVALMLFAVVPGMVAAQETTEPPPTGGFEGSRFITCAGRDCTFADVVALGNNIVDFLLTIAIPIAAALFSYAGFLYVTSAEDPGQRNSAKKIFSSVFVGFVIALSAWLIVNFITNLLGYGNADDVFEPRSAIIHIHERA